MKKIDPNLCDVAQTITLIGGKWKSIIIFYLLGGTLRFGQVQRKLPGITQRMLTLQLRELEADGIVQRTVYPEVPPRVEYSLTPLGQSLRPVIMSMKKWGSQYRISTVASEQTRCSAGEVHHAA